MSILRFQPRKDSPCERDIVVAIVGLVLLIVSFGPAGQMPDPSGSACSNRSIVELELAGGAREPASSVQKDPNVGAADRVGGMYECFERSQLHRITDGLLIDSVLFIPVYVVLLAWCCAIGSRVLRTTFSRHMAWVGRIAAIVAGFLDYVENFSLWQVHESFQAGAISNDWAALAFGASLPKWMLLIFAVFMAVRSFGRAIMLYLQPGRLWARWHPPTLSWRDNTLDVEPSKLGIALSGGGIRSATFAMGALQALGPLARRADHISAVSGGAYFAGARHLMRTLGETEDPFAQGSQEEEYVRRHGRYIAKTAGEWVYLVVRFLVGLLLNVGVLLLLITGLGRALGWAVAWIDTGKFEAKGEALTPLTSVGVGRALAICLGGAVLFAALAVISAPKGDSSDPGLGGTLWHVSAVLGGIGVVVVLLLIGIPALGSGVNALLPSEKLAAPGPGAGVTASSGIIAGLVALFQVRQRLREAVLKLRKDEGARKKFLTTYVKWAGRLAPYLTGLVLGSIALLVFADAFRDAWVAGPWDDTKLLWLVAMRQMELQLLTVALLVVLFLLVDQTFWSAHPFYKRRLAKAFALGLGRCSHERHVVELPYAQPATFEPSPAGWPNLIVCAAANVSGSELAPSGRQAVSLTFEATRIGGPRLEYVSREAFDRSLGRRGGDHTLMAAMAISGAAFASAMGRHSRGSINSLLAVANARLGVWLPSPAYIKDLEQGSEWRVTKRRFTYLFREIFGSYAPDDRFLYITDGGHYENLGLVELLRRRCKTIYCFDASGGPRTLREACELANEELGVTIDFHQDVGDVVAGSFKADGNDPLGPRLAKREVLTASINYPRIAGFPDSQGRLVYARAVLTRDTPGDTKAYAREKVKFPNDPTGDQWFDVDQFNHYLWLGRHAGALAVAQAGNAR